MERCRAGADVQLQLTRSPQERRARTQTASTVIQRIRGQLRRQNLYIMLNLQALGFV